MKTRTMYMHTLDGKPALFVRGHFRGESRAYIAFAGGSAVATLVPTLREIRRQQRIAMKSAAAEKVANHWANPDHYGYVRVEVP